MNTQNDEMMSNDRCAGRCGMGCHRHGAVRVLTTVILLIFVFWCGFEFGEIRATIAGAYGDYGYGMMRGWNNIDYTGIPRMMNFAPSSTAGAAPTTAAPGAK